MNPQLQLAVLFLIIAILSAILTLLYSAGFLSRRTWYRLKGKVVGLLFDFDERCGCGSGMRPHFVNGDPTCEYWKHHCDSCHEFGSCTIKACIFDFKHNENVTRWVPSKPRKRERTDE